MITKTCWMYGPFAPLPLEAEPEELLSPVELAPELEVELELELELLLLEPEPPLLDPCPAEPLLPELPVEPLLLEDAPVELLAAAAVDVPVEVATDEPLLFVEDVPVPASPPLPVVEEQAAVSTSPAATARSDRFVTWTSKCASA
jgi:hypothetical protein